MTKLKRFLTLLGLLWVAGLAVVITNIWFIAMMNGGSVTIYVDLFNEMWPEYIMWYIVWPVITLALYYAAESQSDK